jgi:putative membrane protein
MMLRWTLAALHLLALGIGLGAVWVRARTLRGELDGRGLQRALRADAWWGAAALLWISTGLWRLLAGLEKSTGYYLQNHAFHAKMGLLVVILALEIWPVVTLTGWRRAVAAGKAVDLERAPAIATISVVQTWFVVLMVFAATAMARGIG